MKNKLPSPSFHLPASGGSVLNSKPTPFGVLSLSDALEGDGKLSLIAGSKEKVLELADPRGHARAERASHTHTHTQTGTLTPPPSPPPALTLKVLELADPSDRVIGFDALPIGQGDARVVVGVVVGDWAGGRLHSWRVDAAAISGGAADGARVLVPEVAAPVALEVRTLRMAWRSHSRRT